VAVYTVSPSKTTLHGRFSRDILPVLTIESGDTVIFQTLDAGWGLMDQPDPFSPSLKFEPRDQPKDPGHALCGPVAIRGAEPGMTLEIVIRDIRTGSWGWSSAGGYDSPWNRKLDMVGGEEFVLRWSLSPDRNQATNQHGWTVGLRPIMGIMGMPPDEPGEHSTFIPRFCGGNLDYRELVAGSRLFLPVAVSGGLLSTGDGHAVQGDGELAGPALECPMERAELEFHLRPDLKLKWPRAHTPAAWITFGLHQDLNEAWVIAAQEMLDLMQEQYGLERKAALALAGLVVNLRITQVVNFTLGVHAILPDGVLEGVLGKVGNG